MTEENTEKEILTRWDKLKKWWEIFKFGKWVYALLFLTTGTLAYGEITETNPLRDAAIQVGLIDNEEQLVEEMVDKLIEENNNEEKAVAEHSHPHTHNLAEELSDIIPEDHMELH